MDTNVCRYKNWMKKSCIKTNSSSGATMRAIWKVRGLAAVRLCYAEGGINSGTLPPAHELFKWPSYRSYRTASLNYEGFMSFIRNTLFLTVYDKIVVEIRTCIFKILSLKCHVDWVVLYSPLKDACSCHSAHDRLEDLNITSPSAQLFYIYIYILIS
jgi:hypothetical protein